jgi:hypothetical protein
MVLPKVNYSFYEKKITSLYFIYTIYSMIKKIDTKLA